MDIKDLSVIITTFKSEAKIRSCLNSLPKTLKTYVIENSNNEEFKKEIEKSYSSVECILTGSNKGYSIANNIGLSKIKTKYALVLNPDTIIENTAIENFFVAANENPDFWLIGPDHDQGLKNNFKKNKIYEVDNLKGFAIFFNIKKFNKIFFDENFFLYFEEIDLCKRVKLNNGKIFLDPNIRINHEGGNSVNQNLREMLEENRNWHWMWSTFYFHKKYKGFFKALIIILPKLFSSFLRVIFYQVIFNVKKRNIYFCRLSGLINSIIGNKSWYRPTLD
jgi:N-acetylglucosaminyl-diphospho-decaprenol L-rhamnosyltransferase|tara:strand:- start:136 stop:969 length:834 start_codon:yes stop_codon:yes gene_type:complete